MPTMKPRWIRDSMEQALQVMPVLTPFGERLWAMPILCLWQAG